MIEESEINMLLPESMLAERIEFKFALKKWKQDLAGTSTSTTVMPLQTITTANNELNTLHSSKNANICVSICYVYINL